MYVPALRLQQVFNLRQVGTEHNLAVEFLNHNIIHHGKSKTI